MKANVSLDLLRWLLLGGRRAASLSGGAKGFHVETVRSFHARWSWWTWAASQTSKIHLAMFATLSDTRKPTVAGPLAFAKL